ncbi:MAG: 2-dehydropantoate 2-reductase, partial [Pseudomonadota bacterium]|nr:2-dehydropantoate 2-reductase [Pseudomonadota bacterium]
MARTFQRVAVVGAGAVGGFFGAMLARAGHPVVLVARPAHVRAIERDGLRLERAGSVESIRVDASVDLAAVRGADLILFCVKSTDTDSAAAAMAPHLDAGALVLSLQNGVENAAVIARHVACVVVPAVVYVATSMGGPGVVRHHGRGDLVIGALQPGAISDDALPADLQRLAD